MDLKERIQAKSEELFKKYGIRSITMDEIAGQLGISKKTIYHFYTDKDDLVYDVVTTMLDNYKAGCAKCINDSENAIHEKLLGSIRAKEILANLNPILINDLQRYYPKAFKQFEEYKKPYLLQLIKENIHRGISEGLYRQQVDVDTLAMIHLQQVSIYMQMEEVMKGSVSLWYMEEQMTDFFLHGLATEKGIKMMEKYKYLREQNKLETV